RLAYRLSGSLPLEGRAGEGGEPWYPLPSPLPNLVLCTDYRLRSLAAGDRARCSPHGAGHEEAIERWLDCGFASAAGEAAAASSAAFGTGASSGRRVRSETTTPPGFSTVMAKRVALLIGRRASIGISTSSLPAGMSNTPP